MCVVLFVSPLACSCALCCVSYRMLRVCLWICLLLLRAIHGWRFTVGRTRQCVLRCPGTHHGVARASYAQAAWDGLRGLWARFTMGFTGWWTRAGRQRQRFYGPDASCSNLTSLDCFVSAECDTTCLWTYICEYAASLLEADVFVVMREFMQR